MAQRRMLSLKIIDTDEFLSMPLSSQALYMHLSMRADDDGFVDSPKKIKKMVGAADDDFKLLMAKQYIIPFETGICVIRHWHVHNYIQNDRYNETMYLDEKHQISCNEKGVYTINGGLDENVSIMDTQVRLGKERLGKSIDKEKEVKDIYAEFTFSQNIKDSLNRWLAYKQERREVYKPTGLQSFLSQISNRLKEHKESDIINLIDECMANNWKGIIWDKLKPAKSANNFTKEAGAYDHLAVDLFKDEAGGKA